MIGDSSGFRRIRLFMIGLFFGSMVMYFFVWKDKKVFKSPETTIKEILLRNPLMMTPAMQCKLQCAGITDDDVRALLGDAGEVNYSKSQVHAQPCKKYLFEGKNASGKKYSILFGQCYDQTDVLEVTAEGAPATCNCP